MDVPDSASAHAVANQASQFTPAGISASGNTHGSQYHPSGAYSAASVATFRFSLDTPVDYFLEAWVEEGDVPNTGEIHTTGRLGPGVYTIEGRSSFGASEPFFDGGVYSFIWRVADPIDPLIDVQPPKYLPVPCGNSTTISVMTIPPASTLTFQWRQNGVPLTNNGQFSGVTTPSLTIANTCHPDSGYYNVLVTNGTATVTEPSGYTYLVTVNTGTVITGVDDTPLAPARTLSIEVAGPIPFAAATALRYTVAKPIRATIGIYNASGELTRTLDDGVVSGTRTVAWDGRTSRGDRAAAGIYFVQARAEGVSESRKVVLLR